MELVHVSKINNRKNNKKQVNMKKIVKSLTAFITLLFSTMSYGQQPNSTLKSKKVLIVVTSAAKAENTGHVSGLWIEEFATPYYMLKDAGVTITITSPNGGVSPIDPRSATPAFSTEATKKFYA